MNHTLVPAVLLATLVTLGAASCAHVYAPSDTGGTGGTGAAGGTTTSTGGTATSTATCSVGVPACLQASDCPASTNPCVAAVCEAGCCASVDSAAGTPCPGGMCIGGGVCSNGGCVSTSECPESPSPCAISSCDLATGACIVTLVPDGTPTPGFVQVQGNCHVYVCVGGMAASQEDDSNVPAIPAALAGCADAVCTNGVPSNPLHAVGSPCSAFMGSQPGFCDAAGSCVQCTQDSECPGVSDDCGHPACAGNACTTVFTPAGTPTTTNPLQLTGTCHQIVCDGSGGHMTIVDDTGAAVPSSGTVCIVDTCSNGNVVETPDPGGVCGMYMGMPVTCAMGICDCVSNAECTPPETCKGGLCML